MSAEDTKPLPDTAVLAGLAGEWAQAAQAVAASLIAAEVGAVQAMLAPKVSLTPEAKVAQDLAADAQAEADFDNLPL